MSVEPELQSRLLALARAIDNVLVRAHGPRSALKAPPPWDAPLTAGIERYGPGPVFELWALIGAILELRAAWTGMPIPTVEALVLEEVEAADEAPGLTTELARSNGHDETAQPLSAD
jgi:hypothetical protein